MAASTVARRAPPLDDAERALRDVFADLLGATGAQARAALACRPLVVSPFDGAYGFAGVVVVLNGSPPCGLLVVPAEALESDANPITWIVGGRCRMYHGYRSLRVYQVVTAYVRSLGYTPSSCRGGI